jgi:flagellin
MPENKIQGGMNMRINNNIMALNTHRQLGINNMAGAKSLEKLSSGYRINRAGDDAAGLSISEKMRGQIRGLRMASRNAQDGISMIQTAEGALNEAHSILQRMRELAIQASNGTNAEEDRQALQAEVEELKTELTRIANSTEFNTQKLLDGTLGNAVDTNATNSTALAVAGVIGASVNGVAAGTWTITQGDGTIVSEDAYTITDGTTTYISTEQPDATAGTIVFGDGKITIKVNEGYEAGSLDGRLLEVVGDGVTFQIGANYADEQKMSLSIENMDAVSLGVDGIDISTQGGAQSAVTLIDAAIVKVSTTRSSLGAAQNRLEHTIRNLDTSAENLQAAESRIRDVDMAQEMMEFTKNNILQQAATAMLAQANMLPQSVLQLLG